MLCEVPAPAGMGSALCDVGTTACGPVEGLVEGTEGDWVRFDARREGGGGWDLDDSRADESSDTSEPLEPIVSLWEGARF